jgi:hypothetical protein
LEVRLLEEGFLRAEAGAPVTGLYSVLHEAEAVLQRDHLIEWAPE